MIPPDEEKEKTLVESFLEGLPGTHEYEKKSKLRGLLDQFFKEAFDSMSSWDEWHSFLGSNNIIFVKCRCQNLRDEKWFNWAEQKGLHFQRSPTSEGIPTSKDCMNEFLLVPEKTIEKLIVLGLLEKPS